MLAIEIVKVVRKHHPDIIHCQNSTTVVPGVVVGKLLKIPTVITFRDNQILCNYGLCLTTNQFGKTCNLSDYFAQDFRHYYINHVDAKGALSLAVQVAFACFGRIRVMTLRFFAARCEVKIVSSSAQKRTFSANGFPETIVVNNIFPFSDKEVFEKKPNNTLLYATKLSVGKGLNLLLPAFKEVAKKFPRLRLQIIGGGDRKKYELLVQRLGITDRVEFIGILDKSEVMKFRRKALLEVVPSIYPESFGRSALEALACGVPVVASDRGGLTDIVEDGKTGFTVEPTVKNLSGAIIKSMRLNNLLRGNIKENYQKLRRKFETLPIEQQMALYKVLI